MVAEVVMLHLRIGLGIRGMQRHLAARSGREERGRHCEGVLSCSWKIFEHVLRAVAFGIPDLDVWLGFQSAHRVASGNLGGVSKGLLPELRVFQAVVEEFTCKDAERELGEEARVGALVLFRCLLAPSGVPDQVMIGESLLQTS